MNNEAFDKFWFSVETEYTSVVDEDVARSAWQAAERETAMKCREIAEKLWDEHSAEARWVADAIAKEYNID